LGFIGVNGVNELIRENAGILSLLTFFLGLAIGNRLAIGRDRRKELNEAAKPIRSWLLAEAKSPNPYTKRPSTVEIDLFANCLPFWKRKAFWASFARHDEVRNCARTQDGYGSVSYGNEEEIREVAKKCLTYTKRK